MKHTYRTFEWYTSYENGRDGEKAELIASEISKHIKFYLKQQGKVFDNFMELPLEDLKEIFERNKIV